jgi:hypothetical protein
VKTTTKKAAMPAAKKPAAKASARKAPANGKKPVQSKARAPRKSARKSTR